MSLARINKFARQLPSNRDRAEFFALLKLVQADSLSAAEALFRERMAQKARERTT